MKKGVNTAACVGLALGAVFGMAGTLVTQANVRSVFWAIDAIGLIVATALLTMKFFRKGNDAIAAGFLVFAIGESVMLSGTAMELSASAPSFAAGTAAWSAALFLVSFPPEFSPFVRVIGGIAGVLFGITSGRMFWGEPINPLSSPLPFIGYPFLVLTFLGWIWTLAREKNA